MDQKRVDGDYQPKSISTRDSNRHDSREQENPGELDSRENERIKERDLKERDRGHDRFHERDIRNDERVGERDRIRIQQRISEKSRNKNIGGRYDHRDHDRERRRDSRECDRYMYSESKDRGRRDSPGECYRRPPKHARHDSRERDSYRKDKGSYDRGLRERSEDSRHRSRQQGRSRSRSLSPPRHRGRSRSSDSSERYGQRSKQLYQKITKRTDDRSPLSGIDKTIDNRGDFTDKIELQHGERESYGTNQQIQVLKALSAAENILSRAGIGNRSQDGSASKDPNSKYNELLVPTQPTSDQSPLLNTRPLKSILKTKKTEEADPECTLPESLDKKISELCHSDPQTAFTLTDFSRVSSDAKVISGGLFPAAGPVRPEKMSSGSGLPGMSSYMDIQDIEDEEKFLYGDDDLPATSHSYPSDGRPAPPTRDSHSDERQPSQQTFTISNIQDLYNKIDPKHLNVLGNLQSVQNVQPVQDVQPIRESYLQKPEIPDVCSRNNSWDSQVEGVGQHSTDGLLNIPCFDKPSVQENLTANPSTCSTEKKQMDIWDFLKVPAADKSSGAPSDIIKSGELEKEKHDPTIENILKSIGFDFEMSKRMQERAKSKDVATEQKKPKESQFESQFGINMTASFLGSGIAVDVMKPSFENTNVNQLIKETKESVKHVKKDFASRESQAMKFQNMEQQLSSQDFQSQKTFMNVMDFKEETRFQHQVPQYSKQHRDETHDSNLRKQDYSARRRERSVSASSSTSSSSSYSSSSSQSSSLSSSSRDGYRRRQVRYKKRSSKPIRKTGHENEQFHAEGLEQHVPVQCTRPVTQDMFMPTVGQTDPYASYSQPPPSYVHPEYTGTQQPSYGYDLYAAPVFDNPDVSLPHEEILNYDSYFPGPEDLAAQIPRTSNLREITIVDMASDSKPKAQLLPNRESVKRGSDRKLAMQTNETEDNSHFSEEKFVEKKPTLKKIRKERLDERSEKKKSISPQRFDRRDNIDTDRRASTSDEHKKKLILTPREYDKLIDKREKDKISLKSLEKELQNLRKQQNEFMRKSQRQRGGDKDPVLLENVTMQDEIGIQVSNLRKSIWELGKVLNNAAVEELKFSGSEAKPSQNNRPRNDEIQKAKTEKRVGITIKLIGDMTVGKFAFIGW